MANFYFLLLTLMTLIKPISSSPVSTMLMPLSFVVGVSMIKDIFEDKKRHKSDDEENKRQTQAVIRGENKIKAMQSQDIKVGCIVKVKENDFFPCDILLLNSSIPKGICYVETKNLDGETNLKHKQAHKTLVRMGGKTEDEVVRAFSGA